MTHTPGPWRIETDTTLIWGNCDSDDMTSYGMGYPVADCQHPRSWRRDRPTEAEIDGNARLIVAAPDLLTALKGLLTAIDSTEFDGNALRECAVARAAIAKAEAV